MATPLATAISLTGETALVTGGAMGIGLGIASRLAEAGAAVVIADINTSAGEAAETQLRQSGGKAAFIQTDVSDPQSVQRAVDFAVKQYESIDVLVNNAGIYPNIPVLQMTPADFEKVLAVNLKSVFLFTQAAANMMIAQGRGGKIINITSIDALHPSMVGLAVYDASKHGLWGFTKNSALELAPHRIWVNAIAPGGIATPGTGAGKTVAPDMAAVMQQFLKRIPMQRMGEPDDIGKVALFLASDLSSYMTGSQIVVDGGVLLA